MIKSIRPTTELNTNHTVLGADSRIPLTAFSLETTSRVTGLTESLLRRWDRNGFFSPSYGDPDRNDVNRRIYSYTDLRALRTIAKLREKGVSQRQLHKIRDLYFHRDSNDDWLNRRFWVVGRKLILEHADVHIAGKPVGQQADPYVLDLDIVANEVDKNIVDLFKRRPGDFGKFERHKNILGGTPVFAGTRTPVWSIKKLLEQGTPVDQVLEEFPRLTPLDIEAALSAEVLLDDRATG
jgi:uncharacterized protein (DUF433 family)